MLLVILNNFFDGIGHEFFVFFHKFFFLDIVFGSDFLVGNIVFFGAGLENSLHFAIDIGEGEFGEGSDAELVFFEFEGVFNILFDHFVEFLKVGDGLEVVELEVTCFGHK